MTIDNRNTKTNTWGDVKGKLTILWIFLTVNYIFCDVLSNMEPEFFKALMTGGQGAGLQINQRFLLASAVLMEIPMVMIVLSWVLKYRANRWANIIVGMIMAAVQVLSLFTGTPPTLHYIFYSIIEIGCTLFIVWYAWKWRNDET